MSDMEKPARDAAIRQLIAVRAYEIWENQGRPHGRDVLHWHQAQQDIMTSIEQNLTTHAVAQTAQGDANA